MPETHIFFVCAWIFLRRPQADCRALLRYLAADRLTYAAAAFLRALDSRQGAARDSRDILTGGAGVAGVAEGVVIARRRRDSVVAVSRNLGYIWHVQKQ